MLLFEDGEPSTWEEHANGMFHEKQEVCLQSLANISLIEIQIILVE